MQREELAYGHILFASGLQIFIKLCPGKAESRMNLLEEPDQTDSKAETDIMTL